MRKLVAALAVAVLASMLAIISSPAGAQTPVSPTTNRISGADRYATSVAVARSQIGAAGARAIAESENMANLSTLNLFENQIGDAGKAAIRARFPFVGL